MRKLLAALGVGALVAVVPTVAANASTVHSPRNAITFSTVVCLLPGHSAQSLERWVVNAHAADPAPAKVYDFYNPSNNTLQALFQPFTLTIWVNGQVESTFVRKQAPPAGSSVDQCEGTTTLNTPGGPVTISFLTFGRYLPA
jgi:hypothetical protein